MAADVEILVRLADQTYTMADLAWEHVAPCGCTCGVMDAGHAGADYDAAYKQFLPNADARKRDGKQGFVFRLAPRREVIDRLKGRCSHVPEWGVEKTPIPDGHRWAVRGGSRRSHLVAVPESAPEWSFREWGVPLCGGGRDLWTAPWDDEPPCTRCEKKAREIATASATEEDRHAR